MGSLTFNELLPTILQFNTAEKLRLIRLLAENIEQQDKKSSLQPFFATKIYYVTPPQFVEGTARQLMSFFDSHPSN